MKLTAPRTLLLGAAMTAIALPISACARSDSGFTDEQQQHIGEIAAKYIVDHPEVLQQASQKLQQQQQDQATQQLREGALEQQDALLNDKATPSVGPQDAKVAVVEFFDYQCIYCAHTAPEIEKTMKAHPEARYVFKEFPVFGQRWPASNQAALAGLSVYKEKGPQAYIKYHNSVFGTGKNEGKLQQSDVEAIAAKSGLTSQQLNANRASAEQSLNNTMELAQKLGVMGTPTLVVMPVNGANADNVTVVPGAADSDTLSAAIKKAGG
ncbi:DsbA family protein [Carnimonas bestiolae]|uniref:DsbA family protein n=1 Tax=Carnimonas bestiolae TaxID=3402172 RepID=UPI003EDC5136